MFSKTCECGKVIEGFTEKHVDWQMKQHKLGEGHKKGIAVLKGLDK